MANLRSANSSDKILIKLNKLVDTGEFYEAHQLYRTIYFRYKNAKRYNELCTILFDGAINFLKKNQILSGSDLASLYIEILAQNDSLIKELKDEAVGNELAYKIGDILSLIPSKAPERLNFIVQCLKLKSDNFPLHLIHKRFAQILWSEKDYKQSRYHFLHCNHTCAEDCATMLIEYHLTCGYPSEVDLFITQFILQLLCVKRNNAFANSTLKLYVIKHPQIRRDSPPFLLPLVNFLWFLILAIESGKASVFKILCELYNASLQRDPSYSNFLKRIGEIYFDIRTQPTGRGMNNFFSNFIQSFLEEDGDEPVEQGSQGNTSNQSTTEARPTTGVSEDVD